MGPAGRPLGEFLFISGLDSDDVIKVGNGFPLLFFPPFSAGAGRHSKEEIYRHNIWFRLVSFFGPAWDILRPACCKKFFFILTIACDRRHPPIYNSRGYTYCNVNSRPVIADSQRAGRPGGSYSSHHTTYRHVCVQSRHTHPHRNKWDRYVLLFYFRSAPVRSKFEAPTEISLLKVWWLPSWKANPGWKLKWRASCSASRRAAFLLNIRFLPWIEWGGIEC
jgi:hypothetical protein